jgi:hypothetical protein
MKKIILIGLAFATTLGVGYFLYQKSRPEPADQEMLASPDMPPASNSEEPLPTEAPASLPDPEMPEPVAEPEPTGKTKAATGHFEMTRPGASYDDANSSDNPGYGRAREKKLWEIFKKDKDLARSVLVKNIHCRVDTCIVEAESKDGDAERFQSLLYALIKQYPWIGNKIDVTTPDGNPLKGRFVYFQEIPK